MGRWILAALCGFPLLTACTAANPATTDFVFAQVRDGFVSGGATSAEADCAIASMRKNVSASDLQATIDAATRGQALPAAFTDRATAAMAMCKSTPAK